MSKVEDIDYILDHYVGGGSWWQWKMMFLLIPTSYAGGYPLFLHIFSSYEPQHRCFIPNCDNQSSKMNESHIAFTIPKEHSYANILKENEKFDPCRRYKQKIEDESFECLPENFYSNETVDCESYIYKNDVFTNTITTDVDLVCEGEDYKRNLLSTLMILGLLVGSIIGGRLGDRHGRKKIWLSAIICIVPTVALAGAYPNYILYATMRFLSAVCLPVMWINASAYSFELFSPKYRKYVSPFREFPIAQFLLCLIVYFNRNWQHMHFAVAGTCACGIPLLYFFVPESFRWLLLHNRKEEALKVILQIAKTNGKELSPEDASKIKDIVSNVEYVSKKDENLTPLEMFRGEFPAKTAILLLAWITVGFGYYALNLNSVMLAGDPILNFVYATAADSPVCIFLILTLDRIGRRKAMFLTHVTLGLSCLALAFIPKSQTEVILAVYLLGKSASGAGFQIVWMFTNELYPTNLRTQAVGTCSMISCICSLCVSFISLLARYWQPLPMLVLGVPTVLSGVLALVLPETSGQDLPQTVSDSNQNKLSYAKKNETKKEKMDSQS